MFTAIAFGIMIFAIFVGSLIYGMMFGNGVVDKISAFLLGGSATAVFVLLWNGIDWVNDWLAGRHAQQFNQQALEDMRNQYRVQTEQARSMSAMLNAFGKGQSQIPPHVGFQDEMFEDFDTTPLPD